MNKILVVLLLAGFAPLLGTTPAAADPVACVGRFSQTLSIREDRCRRFWERQIDLSELIALADGTPCPCFDLHRLRTTPPPDDFLIRLAEPAIDELLCLEDSDRIAIGRGQIEPFEFNQIAAAGLLGEANEANLAVTLPGSPSPVCILNGTRGEFERFGQDLAEGEAIACQDIIRQYAVLAEIECVPPPDDKLAK